MSNLVPKCDPLRAHMRRHFGRFWSYRGNSHYGVYRMESCENLCLNLDFQCFYLI